MPTVGIDHNNLLGNVVCHGKCCLHIWEHEVPASLGHLPARHSPPSSIGQQSKAILSPASRAPKLERALSCTRHASACCASQYASRCGMARLTCRARPRMALPFTVSCMARGPSTTRPAFGMLPAAGVRPCALPLNARASASACDAIPRLSTGHTPHQQMLGTV